MLLPNHGKLFKNISFFRSSASLGGYEQVW